MHLRAPRAERSRPSSKRRARQRGAALVEFVLVAPLLFTVLFAVIEFGWGFSQVLDMRHGAREGARLAAVNFHPSTAVGSAQTDEIVAEICGRIDEPTETTITLGFVAATDTGVGDEATITVERNLEQLTGFFAPILNNVTPSSDVTFRLEQDADWAATSGAQACP